MQYFFKSNEFVLMDGIGNAVDKSTLDMRNQRQDQSLYHWLAIGYRSLTYLVHQLAKAAQHLHFAMNQVCRFICIFLDICRLKTKPWLAKNTSETKKTLDDSAK